MYIEISIKEDPVTISTETMHVAVESIIQRIRKMILLNMSKLKKYMKTVMVIF